MLHIDILCLIFILPASNAFIGPSAFTPKHPSSTFGSFFQRKNQFHSIKLLLKQQQHQSHTTTKSRMTMTCDSYCFRPIFSSGNAIMVTNADIKETRTGNPNDGSEATTLDKDDIQWLLENVEGYHAFSMSSSFVLLIKEGNSIIEGEAIKVPGPYEIEKDFVRFKIEKVDEGSKEYIELCDVARKLTPQGQKLSFPPGQYLLSMTQAYLVRIEELSNDQPKPVTVKNDDKKEFEEIKPDTDFQVKMDFPVKTDFELVVGEGDYKTTIAGHKAILFSFFPKLEALVGGLGVNKLDLPDLYPMAVQKVLDMFTTRNGGDMPPYMSQNYKVVKKVMEKFGIEDSPKAEHDSFFDPRWLDAKFLVGPNKEEVEVSRVVLASLNPVLCRILYGTGSIKVDQSKPIMWEQFDAIAVRCVFSALLKLGKEEVVVPLESVESAKSLVDYLMETSDALRLYYETPFKRECENGDFNLILTEDGYYLKMGDYSLGRGFCYY